MTSGRKKRRTHVRTADNAPEDNKKVIPKSFVVRGGTEISRPGNQLVRDLRRVMEPNTATRLKERKTNKVRDYLAMAGPLGVSHIMVVAETEETINIRLGKFPRGPTMYFRVLKYSLAGDVRAAARRPKSPGLEYGTPALLVLNNFDIDKQPEHKLLVTFLQNYYPTMNATRCKLSDLRRVVLYNYDEATDTVEFRHYLIRVKERGLSRIAKQLNSGEIPVGLSNFADISDYVTRSLGAASESEADEDSTVTLGQDYLGKENTKASQRSVTLSELGPRLSMKLIKISDGLNDGKVLYHVPTADVAGDIDENGE